MTAPAEMPGVEEIARLVDDYAFKSWQQAHDYEMKTTGDAEEAVKFADWSAGKRLSEARDKARAILDLFAPILAEKERQLTSFRQYVAMHRDRALAAEAALAAERERCAKVAEGVSTFEWRGGDEWASGYVDGKNAAAAAIRAEGE